MGNEVGFTVGARVGACVGPAVVGAPELRMAVTVITDTDTVVPLANPTSTARGELALTLDARTTASVWDMTLIGV